MDELSRESILKTSEKLISPQQAIAGKYQIIDVRSAPEFFDGTMPDAVNAPLFDESERSVIGTLYNHGGRSKAIDQGFSYARDKLESLLDSFTPYRQKKLAIFCARGGMRSRSVVNLLAMHGYEAVQVAGGYKAYRRMTLDVLDSFAPRLIVLHGLTGTGKTRILQKLENAIDLEELAGHRSSLFGGLGMETSTQKTFEAGLVHEISLLGKEPYFIEGESRKIGKVFIPKPLAGAMKRAVLVNITCSLETRIARIIQDYPVNDESRRREIAAILATLKSKLGGAKVQLMQELLYKGDLYELVRILLLEYYDKRYARSMRDYQFSLELSSEDINQTVRELNSFRLAL